jgi:hypothetical protein
MPRIPFGDKLAIYGWSDREVLYNHQMSTLWEKEYKKRFRNVEQLLFNPLAALKFCEDLRMITSVYVPHEDILQNLMNLRKRKVI